MDCGLGDGMGCVVRNERSGEGSTGGSGGIFVLGNFHR